MKKIIYTLLISVFLLSINGCNAFWTVIFKIMHGQELYSDGGELRGNADAFGILVGEGGAIMTSDGVGPVNWIERQSSTTETLNFVKYHPYSLEPEFFAVGNSGTVLFSTDKGHNWENRSIASFNFNLYGVTYFGNPGAPGLAVCGESGMVCISTDGGFNWNQHTTITTNKLNSIFSYGNDNFVAVGENGTIIKGGPGIGWENKSVDPNVHLYKVYNGVEIEWFELWAVGSGGKIYYSSNYGIDWTTRNSGVTTDLYDIKFKNVNHGIIAGAGGVVRYTTDRGSTWLSDPYFDGLTNGDIIAVSAVDTNTATAIVHNATESIGGTLILSVSTEPFTNVDDQSDFLPDEFRLEQNYPNPFNPSTSIQYAISSRQFVQLKVYDVLGHEVATLVNEEKETGVYSVDFDATSLASGLYLYRLSVVPTARRDLVLKDGQVGSFVETKKMILLK